MRLVYKFEIHPNKTTSLVLGLSTYAAARLYNVGNYERHNFNELGFDKMPDWYSQKKNLKTDMWYKSLPSQTSQDILQRLDEGWKSYFKLKQTGGIEEPNPPRYKPKDSHFNIEGKYSKTKPITFTNLNKTPSFKLNVKGKNAIVKIKNFDNLAKGYQIKYSENKNFKRAKTFNTKTANVFRRFFCCVSVYCS